jgi:hypothetical protein
MSIRSSHSAIFVVVRQDRKSLRFDFIPRSYEQVAQFAISSQPAFVLTNSSMPLRLPEAIEHWPLERLIPYGRNARTQADDQMAPIAASIVEFGWMNPALESATVRLL